MQITLEELLAYAVEEQAKWEQWFEKHREKPLSFAVPGERHPTLADLILHSLGTQLWFAERLRNLPLTEWWKGAPPPLAALFRLGTEAKAGLRELIRSTSEAGWAETIVLRAPDQTFRLTLRKAVANALLHELRHWSQVAVIARQNGIAPPGDHDVIFTKAFD